MMLQSEREELEKVYPPNRFKLTEVTTIDIINELGDSPEAKGKGMIQGTQFYQIAVFSPTSERPQYLVFICRKDLLPLGQGMATVPTY
jgi:hypothetical protein